MVFEGDELAAPLPDNHVLESLSHVYGIIPKPELGEHGFLSVYSACSRLGQVVG